MNDCTPSRRIALLWFLIALVAGVLFAHAALPGIAPASDLWDYSQEARQLARGQGFTSMYTYPIFLDHEVAPFPVRWRMPLYAALGAFLLRLGIALPAGFLYLGAIAHALLVALTYWLGTRLSSRRAGAWAATAALSCPLLLDFYNPGMSQSLAAVLGVMVWLLLLGESGALAGALAGVAASAAWFLRAESILFAPVWIWLAARPSGAGPRRGRAAAFTVAYVALCLPWFLASRSGGGTIQGNPMLLYTAEYPGYSSSRTLAAHLPGMLEYVSAHPSAFALRFVKDVAGYVIDLVDGIGPIAFIVALGGVVMAGRRETGAVLRRFAPFLLAISLQIVAMSALERSPRFLVPVLPLVFVMLGVLAAPALAHVARRETFIALVFALVVERAIRVGYQRGDALRRFPPAPEGSVEDLRARSWPTGALILSDAPDWISWHLDRPAVLLPLRAQLDSLVTARPVTAIWLSPGARARNVADGDTAWVGVMDRNERLGGLSEPEALPGGSRLYMIDSTRPAHPGRQP